MRRITLAVIATITATLAVSGCGSDSLGSNVPKAKSTATVTAAVDADAAALVPAAIKSKGELVVGSALSSPPLEFLDSDGQTAMGYDVDLFKLVGATLGLKVTFQNANFDSIISGVNSGKYDVGVSGFSTTTEREKSVDMVSYYDAGTWWATAAGNPKNVDPTSPCGANVAVQTGTNQQDDVNAKAKACEQQGKSLHIDAYDQSDQVTAAVRSGKDDAMLQDSPLIAYAVKLSDGKLQTVGDVYASSPYSYVVAQNNRDLSNAILAALKVIEANGSYQKALDNWGVGQGALKEFALNPTVDQ
jgi:polar amino acid transport system substrate-binding protein